MYEGNDLCLYILAIVAHPVWRMNTAAAHVIMKNVPLTRWDPLRDLLALHEQLGHLCRGVTAPGWTPPVDLYETAAEFVMTAELPGLTRDQIEIHAEDMRVVIRGARTADAERDIPCEQYHRVERGHGRFSRAFSLPESIDARTRHGRSEVDGVLTVIIPKARDRGTVRVSVR